jgi:PTH2 family peptidyl-tRNA hydrolase
LTQEIKQVIVVRCDIKMGKGKLSAQVAHAAVSASEKAKKSQNKIFNDWILSGQAKIVVKANSLEEILHVYNLAKAEGLIAALIRDKGLTQVLPGTITCVGVGPGYAFDIDHITGDLKLL